MRQIRTSNEYSASNSNLHRCIFTGFPERNWYRGSFAREQDATSRPNMIEDGRGKKKEKMQMHVPERVVRVLVRTFGCITVRFRAWHGRKMSGHSLL